MQDRYNVSRDKEALLTSINAIMNMPPSVKEAFANSPEGKAVLKSLEAEGKTVIKGIELEAENNKPADKEFGMTWTKSDIEKVFKKLQEANYEDRGLLLQMLPGPVVSILQQKLSLLRTPTPERNEQVEIAPKGPKYTVPGFRKSFEEVTLEKGAKAGSPGYNQWVGKVRDAINRKQTLHTDGTRFEVLPHKNLKANYKAGLLQKSEYDSACEEGGTHHVYMKKPGGKMIHLSSHDNEQDAVERKELHNKNYKKMLASKNDSSKSY